jgi:hypothetical protein
MASPSVLIVIVAMALVAAAPLPPGVEKINKEGIPVTGEVSINGGLTPEAKEATHLFKLQKGKTYVVNLAGPEIKANLRIDGPDGKRLSLDAARKNSFTAALDGPYRFRVVGMPGAAGKYLLAVKPAPAGPPLPQGVHVVGPGGLQIDSALNANDPIDKVRKQLCKTFEVKMSAGKAYTIDMISQQIDSFLRLEDAGGKQLAQDDDSGGNLNARIVFRPQQDGVYRVISTTFAQGVGNFTLKVKEQ